MAVRISSAGTIPNISSGVYFREIDLTVVTQSVGGFSAASVGLTEKGPAFAISNSATFDDRAFRLGDLNTEFPSSYYARQYLEQARNYKEVRLLGLEGYSDIRGWGILYATSGNAAAVPGTSPLGVGTGALACVLKERQTADTGRLSITSVAVATATYIDPLTGLSTVAATDYLFNLIITYSDASTETIITSLRPESPDYIVTKFGNEAFTMTTTGAKSFPLITNKYASLWVDFITPSVQTRPSLAKPLGYYAPGSNTTQNYLALTTGNMIFGTNFTYHSANVTAVTILTSGPTVIGTQVTVTGDITGWWSGGGVKGVTIAGVTGTGNMSTINSTWSATNVVFGSPNTTFQLNDITDATNGITTPLTSITSSSTYTSGGTAAQYAITTFEPQVLNFANVPYQTPITPWFVSDGNTNGDYKRLFRFQSISDGASANTETKVEIKNISPTTNGGNGSFDVVVRKWSDSEDIAVVSLETFSNLTMDPTSDNYIQRRIGDGENFALRSRFIIVEMNTDEQIPANSLPYGCFGYPNIAGSRMIDVKWAAEYDLTKSLTKQSLGLVNNSINMYAPVAPDQLGFKNITGASGVIGKGFHLNPNNNATFATNQASVFSFANQTIYQDINGKTITPSAKVARSRYVVDFYGGFDGWNVYEERTFGDPSSKDYQALLMGTSLLNDKENIDADFTILTTPDIFFDTEPAACELVLDMVISRGDCLYIPDMSYDVAADVNNAVDLLTASNMLTNSTAVYFPWLQIQDTTNKVNVWLPPSVLALGTIAYVAQNENVWQPPGGSIRTVTNNLVRSRRRLVLSDREALKTVNINPITLFPGSGYEITEVRTTQTVFSALSFVHNRLLLCYAKKILNQTLRPLLFQLNNQLSQTAFISTVTPIFDRIKKLNGLSDYSVSIVDHPELNDRTTLYGQIVIVPLYPIERIVVDFVLQDSGVSFNQ